MKFKIRNSHIVRCKITNERYKVTIIRNKVAVERFKVTFIRKLQLKAVKSQLRDKI